MFRRPGLPTLSAIVPEVLPTFLKRALNLKYVTDLDDNHQKMAGLFLVRTADEPNLEKIIKLYRVPASVHGWNQDQDLMLAEISALSTISHPNIVTFLESFHMYIPDDEEDSGVPALYQSDVIISRNEPLDPARTHLMGGVIIEKMTCTLSQWLDHHDIGHIGDRLLEALFQQIGSALDYLHTTHCLVHGDATGENIGVVMNTPADQLPVVKLFDFGHSQKSTAEAFQEAVTASAAFSLAMDEVEPANPKPTMKCNYTLNNYPINVWAANLFLNESFKFAQLLIALSQGRTNPAITNKRLLKILKLMAPVSGTPQVTVGWALAEYSSLI